jgi:hypothetical protein
MTVCVTRVRDSESESTSERERESDRVRVCVRAKELTAHLFTAGAVYTGHQSPAASTFNKCRFSNNYAQVRFPRE